MRLAQALLLVSLVCLLSAAGCGPAQVQDAPPAGQAPSGGPQAEAADPLYRPFDWIDPPSQFPPHPRLFLNPREIKDLKAWIERNSKLREYVNAFVAEMLQVADSPELPDQDRSRNVNLARQANRFALAYTLSDEPKLAEAAAAILRAYIGLFPGYEIALFKGKATDSTLAEVQWAAYACAAYDLIYNAGVLSDQEKTALEQNVFKPSGEVMLTCNHAFRSNWRIAAVSGAGVVGFCIGDRDLLAEALNGSRAQTGQLVRDGFVNQMAWSMLADGVYYERSGSYTSICLLFYTWLLEAARHSGSDLWRREFTGAEYDLGVDADREFDNVGPKIFKYYFDALCYRAFGDGSMAKVGNDGSGRLDRQAYWAAAWRAYRDPKYAWAFHNGLNGAAVGDPLELMFVSPDMPAGKFDLSADVRVGLTGEHTNACSLLPNGGFAVLRQSAEKDAVGAALTYGQYANAHSHPDQLSLCLYAAGEVMAQDFREYPYGHEGHLGWAKQTIAHNTVTVDEVSQYPQGEQEDVWAGDTPERPAFGRLAMFHPGRRLRAFRATTDSVYDGVVLDRTIALVNSVVVDFFRCRSADRHQYDLALHIDGELTEDGTFGPVQSQSRSTRLGYRYLTDIRRATTSDQPVPLTFTAQSGLTMRVTLLPDGPAELIAAKGYPNPSAHRRSALIVRKTDANVDFVSAMGFAGSGDAQNIWRLTDLPAGLLGVRIDRPDGRADLVISAETPGTYTVAGQTFTGQVALLRATDRSATVVDTAP